MKIVDFRKIFQGRGGIKIRCLGRELVEQAVRDRPCEETRDWDVLGNNLVQMFVQEDTIVAKWAFGLLDFFSLKIFIFLYFDHFTCKVILRVTQDLHSNFWTTTSPSYVQVQIGPKSGYVKHEIPY